MNAQLAFRIAAIIGFLGVALGAFGAHGLKALLEKNQTLEIWKTGSLYHLIHAVVLLFVATRNPFPAGAWWSFLLGILIFSGSLHILATTNIRWLGAITPIGGVCFLIGWLLLVIRGN